MPRRRTNASNAARWLLALTLLALGIAAAVAAPGLLRKRPAYLDLPRALVQRQTLQPTLRVGGDVDTAQKTVVECELAPLALSSGFSGIQGSSSSTIIELIEDGAVVEKDQVIARLDSSEYEELVRQYEIIYSQAVADEQKAILDLEVARIALREYRDGNLVQTRDNYEIQRVLHEAEIERKKERVAWTEKMLANGYVSSGELLQEQVGLQRAQIDLNRVRGELHTLDTFTAQLNIRRLENEVSRQEKELEYQRLRLKNREEQLQKFRDQVQACTIRAPHAGMVIYVDHFTDAYRVELGAWIYNKMALFYLPDLTELEIHSELHESMILRVHPGQQARIHILGLPDLELQGHVKSIDPIPKEPKNWQSSREIRNFLTKIVIHDPPPEILPGMSAEVQIQSEAVPTDSLLIPTEALTVENDQQVVYVDVPGGLARRVVQAKHGDIRNVEIKSGLLEGDSVILNPRTADLAPYVKRESSSLADFAYQAFESQSDSAAADAS